MNGCVACAWLSYEPFVVDGVPGPAALTHRVHAARQKLLRTEVVMLTLGSQSTAVQVQRQVATHDGRLRDADGL